MTSLQSVSGATSRQDGATALPAQDNTADASSGTSEQVSERQAVRDYFYMTMNVSTRGRNSDVLPDETLVEYINRKCHS